jgi:transposase
MNDTVFAIDLAKSVFQVAVSHHPGTVSKQYRLTRNQLLRVLGKQPPAVVLMEACGSAHFWGRELARIGHRVRLLPVRHVAPYRTGNKTDRIDVEAMLEAGRNEKICDVPVKSIEQQSLTALHRIRSRWLASRTARINTLRGLLREFGLVIPLGATKVVPQVRSWIDDPQGGVPTPIHAVLRELCDEIGDLERRMRLVEVQMKLLGHPIPAVSQLQTVPGIGLLTATAMVAFVGNPHRFPSGRHFASYLGLTPRERSSGSSRHLGRISKRGDTYIRMLLIHGARAVLCHAKRPGTHDSLRRWALALEKKRGHNVAAVALANRIARIAWAIWSRNQEYREVSRQA